MIKNGLYPRFAEVGKIKIGGKGKKVKSQNNKDYRQPIRFEHFVVTTTERGDDGNFIVNKDIMQKLGAQPKEIPVRLPFDDIDMNFFTSYQFYKGSKCLCRGDGEFATRTDKDGNESKVECDTKKCIYLQNTINEVKTKDKCKVSGILSCHLPLSMEVGAVHRFRTHSFHTVSGIVAALNYFSKNTNGILQGLPLKLKFIKKATQDHGNVNTVTIVLDGVEMLKMREMARLEYRNRMELGIDMKTIEKQAVEAGFMVDTDDPADVEDEFYTEPVVDTDEKADPGESAEDVKEKLDDKSEKAETEDKAGASDGKQGSLL